MNNFQALLDAAKDAPKVASKKATAEDTELEAFVSWLETSDPAGVKTHNTARSYKSYVIKATEVLASGGTWDDLDTNQRSGAKAFARYTAATATEAAGEDVLDDPDEELLRGLAAEGQD